MNQPKNGRLAGYLQPLKAVVYAVFYKIIQFFIYIGDATRFVLASPILLIKLFKRQLTKLTTKKTSENKPPGFIQVSVVYILLRLVAFLKTASRRIVSRSKKIAIVSGGLTGAGLKKTGTLLFILGRELAYAIVWTLLLPYRIFMALFSVKFRFTLFGFIICLLVLFIYQSYLFVKNLPSPLNIGKVNYALSTHIYDRNGKLLYEVFRDQNRTPVKLKELPTFVANATIAIEDKDYYRHNGVSLFSGILRALKDTWKNGDLQGGSTITQQLVKTSLLTPERTLSRKVKEIILALWTERLYNKQQILEMYFNQVGYGGSAYGIEEASKVYFGKAAKNLSLEEAALLAGLPQQPSVYSPQVNPDLAIRRRNDVLKKMYEQKYISQADYNRAIKTEIVVIPPKTDIKAPHFVFYVKANLEKQYGSRQVEEGGFNVTTTLDLDLQTEVETILKEELEKVKNLNVTNGAILVTRPQTGEILAMVGSVDYYQQPFGAYNVVTASRQPGSSIKPLMYSLALERGYTAATLIDDTPVAFSYAGGEVYRPVNYDGRFHGKVPLRYSLANSYNIPAVRVLNSIGIDPFVNHAKRMGISSWEDSSRFGLSLTLGGGEVTMLDMATAFGVFANQGYRVDLTDTVKLEDSRGSVVSDLSPNKVKVMGPGVTYIISDILSDDVARQWAFGPHSFLDVPGYKVAVKTGTTNDKKDNWTIGYTPNYLVSVWVGNNDNTPMNPYLTSGITGAAPIWNRVMTAVIKRYKESGTWFTKPAEVVEKNCYFGRSEYFLRGTENSVGCQSQLKPSNTANDSSVVNQVQYQTIPQ